MRKKLNTNKKINELPNHLKKYITEQNYDRYSPEDQAVWRFTMRQLKSYLTKHTPKCYLQGLEKTGVTTERIPKISDMNDKLLEFGWGAIPVSGFIPPAIFMEFQARGFLPIAEDIRTAEHILYTPAPDIIHEAAGHAPIIADSQFANYLKSYAEVASNAIISSEDLELYTAIRQLSDVKENPSSTDEDIKAAEIYLGNVNQNISFVSEASLLGRMNWWTAEYGLIGPLESPSIFGAGLLSSISESRDCLNPHVEKIPLDSKCLEYTYDITEPQPQLFVTPNFDHLTQVLNELAETMAFKKGGAFALERTQEAKTINTIELDSGLQISGVLAEYKLDGDNPIFIKLSGPSQICLEEGQLDGHGIKHHSHGYSTPLGNLKGVHQPIHKMSAEELAHNGIYKANEKTLLTFESGITLEGTVNNILTINGINLIVSFSECTVKHNEDILFDPSWGVFDLGLGTKISSVFGGAADRLNFEETKKFEPLKVPVKDYTDEQIQNHKFYLKIRSSRETGLKENTLIQLIDDFFHQHDTLWLAGVELLELSHWLNINQKFIDKLESHLNQFQSSNEEIKRCIQLGIKLATKKV